MATAKQAFEEDQFLTIRRRIFELLAVEVASSLFIGFRCKDACMHAPEPL